MYRKKLKEKVQSQHGSANRAKHTFNLLIQILIIGTDSATSKIIIKSKNDRLIKKKRHDLERKWNEIFYDDIEKQLKFKEIEYVDGKKPANQLHEASKKYYRDRNQLKDNNYINQFGELQKIEHYLAYYEDGQADVLDEDWFCVKSDDEDKKKSVTKEYRITPSKFKHINKYPNKRHALSSKDIGRIKKHCDYIKGLCDIKNIKRINNNVDITDSNKRLETVQFFEEKKKDNKTEYVTHFSCSKYEFEGVDAKNRKHHISKDWVEINFRKNDPDLYKKICNLKVGERIKFEVGSSDVSSNKLCIREVDRGCKIKFIQGDEPSCLFLPLANALHILGEPHLSLKLTQVFSDFFHSRNNNKKPSMKDILMITKSNKYHVEGERRFKFLIQRMKHPINAVEILESNRTNPDIIYHCVLTNSHSICLVGTMIIDPVFKFTLPRSEKYLQLSAGLTGHSFDQTKDIIYQCYKYTKIKRTK